MSFVVDVPDLEDPIALADWIEVLMLRSNKAQLSRARLADTLAAQMGATAQEMELPLNSVFGEIMRRRRIAGSGYPLSVNGAMIRAEQMASCAFYRFLLLVSLDGPMRRARRFAEVDQTFDKVVSEAIKGYFGSGTETLRFGWPVSGGRPTNFQKALEWLSERIGLPVGCGKAPRATKDGGLDIVAWKPFKDRRSAFALALVQCTVQSDWHPKSKDILDHVWLGRIDSGRPILTSLAVPFVIPRNYPKWDELRRITSIVFDRLRLTQVLADRDVSYFREMIEWSEREMSKIEVQ